jgi:hypothetical protein
MEPMLVLWSGVTLLVVATVLRLRISSRVQARPMVTAFVAAGVMVVLVSSIASATHTVITPEERRWSYSPWNGYKVYLSSPRHTDSRSRGECGWEENINGRHWNYYAASVDTGGAGSIYDRHYSVAVSANARDGRYADNVSSANNWGADVYIVTHTNANVGCGNSASYLLVMYRTGVANSVRLTNELLSDLDPATPGGQNSWNCDGLYECLYANASHRAYVELFFHTNQSAVNWFQGDGLEGHGGVTASWRYGVAVDERLGYPR